MALTLDSVQTGLFSFAAADGQETATITNVGDISDCVLLFTLSANESFPQPQHSAIRGEITDTTTLTFHATDADSSSRTVEWQVLKFAAADVDVQRGTADPTTVPEDVTITSIGDLDDAWEIYSGADLTGTGYAADDFFELYLTSTTNLRVDAHAGNAGAVQVAWQVCKFESAAEFSAQRGALATDAAATTEFTATITSVTQANAFAVANGWKINGGVNPDAGAYLAKLNSGTQVAMQKSAADTTDAEARYLVGELPNVDIQTGLFSFAAADGQETATITAVSSDRAVFGSGWAAWGQGIGKAAYAANDLYGEAMARLKFNTTTEIQADRSATNDTADIQWFVLDFSPGGGGATVGLLPSSLMLSGVGR